MKSSPELTRQSVHYADIHLPKNSSVGLFVAAFAFAFGFSMVWHIWWAVPAALLALFITLLKRSFVDEIEEIVPASVVAAHEARRLHASL
jgi:cytochrome o ubiquinol oxidase subunit 1